MAEVVRIGAFFDGTGGHKENDEKIGDGALTNIPKLHELYRQNGFIPLYESGVGTREYKDGKTLTDEQAKAIREGSASRIDYYDGKDLAFGGTAKEISDSMMRQIDEQIADVKKANPNAQIVVDVYGFSRGAAISRDFINSFNEKYKNDKNIGVDFVGLYDTVASVGTKDDLYNGGLNLDLGKDSANKIVQFTAQDEYRFNFPLHSLTDKYGKLASNMEQISLYGAHADVGGGYADKYLDDIIKKHGTIFYGNYIDKDNKIEALCKTAEEKGYERVITSQNDSLKMVTYQCTQKEEKTNELGKVGLHAMYQKALQHGITFKDTTVLEKYPLPEKFQDYTNAIVKGEDISKYKEVVKPYISQSGRSFSVKDGSVKEDSLLITLVNMARDKREVFANDPGKAVSKESGQMAQLNDKSVDSAEKTAVNKNWENAVKGLKEFQNRQPEIKKDYGIERMIGR
ncbi:MAG: DUF2235 domain-containing protein [Campylobacteraceae bacterium]|jgi:hypothetical protein|nr:DUF2235 domain-containing protein [Campylobacteraceae bacterium]